MATPTSLSPGSPTHAGITIECRTKSLKESPKCFDLPDLSSGHSNSQVLTSNNVVVALTINDDHEGAGLKTGNSGSSVDSNDHVSKDNRVALITIETDSNRENHVEEDDEEKGERVGDGEGELEGEGDRLGEGEREGAGGRRREGE